MIRVSFMANQGSHVLTSKSFHYGNNVWHNCSSPLRGRLIFSRPDSALVNTCSRRGLGRLYCLSRIFLGADFDLPWKPLRDE